jgi:hypothetical protein
VEDFRIHTGHVRNGSSGKQKSGTKSKPGPTEKAGTRTRRNMLGRPSVEPTTAATPVGTLNRHRIRALFARLPGTTAGGSHHCSQRRQDVMCTNPVLHPGAGLSTRPTVTTTAGLGPRNRHLRLTPGVRTLGPITTLPLALGRATGRPRHDRSRATMLATRRARIPVATFLEIGWRRDRLVAPRVDLPPVGTAPGELPLHVVAPPRVLKHLAVTAVLQGASASSNNASPKRRAWLNKAPRHRPGGSPRHFRAQSSIHPRPVFT